MKTWKKALLYAYLLVLIAVPGWLVYSHYDTLTTGEDFWFIVQPYDPYDPFRGRYVALRTEQRLQSSEGEYALLERDASGYAVVSGWSDERPRGVSYAHDLALERYYMNETMAPEAERMQRELAEGDDMALLVKVKNGDYVIAGLYLNGVPVEELIAW